MAKKQTSRNPSMTLRPQPYSPPKIGFLKSGWRWFRWSRVPQPTKYKSWLPIEVKKPRPRLATAPTAREGNEE